MSTPKTITKAVKRKPDRSDDRPSKKAAVTPGDNAPKEKSHLKPSHGAGKGVMTSSGPIIEGPCSLLTHKDYAVREVGSFIKPTNIRPCDLLGTEDLGHRPFLISPGYACCLLVKLVLFRFD